jgi:hypothetical protein
MYIDFGREIVRADQICSAEPPIQIDLESATRVAVRVVLIDDRLS